MDYKIKEIGRLGLGFKTMISRVLHDENGINFETQRGHLDDGLDIYLWDSEHQFRWTIADWSYNAREGAFEFNEIGDRLINPDVDFVALKELMTLGHELLKPVEERFK